MGVVYADRGFLSINGVEMIDVENVELRINDGTKVVGTMTRNRRNKGTVKGNRDITISCGIAVQNKLGTPKAENIDYENNSVAMTVEIGADRYTCTDVDFVDTTEGASGVGSEAKKSWNFVAMDILDQTGNSALFPTALSSIVG